MFGSLSSSVQRTSHTHFICMLRVWPELVWIRRAHSNGTILLDSVILYIGRNEQWQPETKYDMPSLRTYKMAWIFIFIFCSWRQSPKLIWRLCACVLLFFRCFYSFGPIVVQPSETAVENTWNRRVANARIERSANTRTLTQVPPSLHPSISTKLRTKSIFRVCILRARCLVSLGGALQMYLCEMVSRVTFNGLFQFRDRASRVGPDKYNHRPSVSFFFLFAFFSTSCRVAYEIHPSPLCALAYYIYRY